ncbi:MAG: glycoside hydrolase family 28 protein [Ruminococcaceae bacterium]|nr:glycoside hydrolase family 28 protein [Oscillospiraceae bacterium]
MFFKGFPLPSDPIIPTYTVNIKDFGAKVNEKTNAISLAIEHASKNGGGKVVIPKGEWLTGQIHLKSNIELHLEDGAKVSFSKNPEDFLPVVLTMYEGMRCYNYSPLIYANEVENVAVTGNGVFDGNGAEWWKWSKNMTARDILYKGDLPLEKRIFGTPEYGLRPMMLQILNGKNVLIDGITLCNSPCWTLNLVWCKDSIVRNVTINNPTASPNTDGINIESCNRVIVEDCTVITTGDDMYCLKAGRNEDAREVGIPCENVIIRRCKSLGPSRSGSIVIGSEMSAGVRNILAEDCTFAYNVNCVRIKSKDGRGGVVENVDFRNLYMEKGMRGINLSYRYSCEARDDAKEPGKYMPTIRNISFENIVCDSVQTGITLDNLPNGVMENLHFKDITMTADKCMTSDSVKGLYMENVNLIEVPGAGANLYDE